MNEKPIVSACLTKQLILISCTKKLMNVLLFSFLFIFCKSSEAQVSKIYDPGILTNYGPAKVNFESVTTAGDLALPDISGIPFSTGKTTKNRTTGLSAIMIADDCTPPTITLDADPSVCIGVTSADLTYSATTDNPDQYSIDFDAAAEAQGFVDVVNATLPASPIVITISGAAAGTYNGDLTVYNSTTGCVSTAYPITVTVNPNANAGTVSGTSLLCIGATDTYSSNGDAGGSWSSTDPAVATVDPSTGQVTAVSAGTTDITYTVSSGCGSPVSSFLTLTVNPDANAGTVSGTSTLCIGATDTYSSDGDGGGSWSSTNTGVATVDASTGLLTAVSAGTADITYTAGCNASAFLTLTVGPNAGTVSGTASLCMAATDTYSSNGDAGGSWSSTDPAVATVDPSTGQVTAVSAGTTDITYTVSSGCGSPVSSFLTLTVNPDANAGTVSGNSTLCIGATDTYSSDGDGGGSWSSTNPGVATVDPTTGQVTAVSQGTTDITYTVTGCGSPATTVMTLTVNPDANAGTLSGASSLCMGATDTYSSDGDAGGSWSSTDPAVATVDASTGLVTAVNTGTTDITYAVGCNASAFMTLTVNAISGALASDGSCKNMNPGTGATYFDGSCNAITRLVPNGGNPLSGMVNSCVTIDGTVQTYNGQAYVQRHYDIEPATSPGTATAGITLYALQNEFDTYNASNGTDPDLPTGPADAAGIANLIVTQMHGTGTAPGNYSGAAVLINPADADIVWDATNNWWAITFDVTGFSGFYIHTGFGVLPVTILNFSGYKDGNRNQLRWTTASENNNRGFDMQRSADGVNYSSLGFVNSQALDGNSTIQLNYTFTDNSVIGSRQYYRLRQVNFDGHNKFSNIVLIKTDKPVTLMIDGFFPNPASTLVNVLIAAPNKDKLTLLVTDIAGRTILYRLTSLPCQPELIW
jgi:trimeric autotransporter adhesin